ATMDQRSTETYHRCLCAVRERQRISCNDVPPWGANVSTAIGVLQRCTGCRQSGETQTKTADQSHPHPPVETSEAARRDDPAKVPASDQCRADVFGIHTVPTR